MKCVPYGLLAVAALLVGCGGNDPEAAPIGPVEPPAPTGPVFIEAVIAPGGIAPTNPADYVVQDALNIEVGQTVQFQLVSYADNGVRTVLPTDNWRTNDDIDLYGQIGVNSGLFTASSQAAPVANFVGTRYRDVPYSAAYQVRNRAAILVGQVTDTTGAPVRDATIEFYNSVNQLVGRVRQPFQGNFRAIVPLNTTAFVVVSDGLPANLRRAFTYDGRGYLTGDISCAAPIEGPLSIGTNTIPVVRIARTSDPEPDLDGCGL
jgi:hypothetical protein